MKLSAKTRRKGALGHPRAIPDRECFRVNLRDRLCCANCGRKPFSRETYHRGFEYHHVVPVRAGGRGVAENIVLLCKRCHRLADSGHMVVHPEDLSVPPEIPCARCAAPFDPAMVGFNGAVYECPACGERTHLYDHFGYRE